MCDPGFKYFVGAVDRGETVSDDSSAGTAAPPGTPSSTPPPNTDVRVSPAFPAIYGNKRVCVIEEDAIAKGELIRFVSNEKTGERVVVHDRCLTPALRSIAPNGTKVVKPSWL
jgi:hypothetical protein